MMREGKEVWKARVGMGICAAILVGALLYAGAHYKKQREAEQSYQALKEQSQTLPQPVPPEVLEPEETEADIQTEDEKDAVPRRENLVDFETLRKTNEDIYAWIEIPGTSVDYPVLQHPDDDGFYLDHTVERAQGLPGSIYSEKIHPKDFSAVNTVLYGHNMKNGTMFGALHNYEDAAFFEENPYVYVFLPGRTLTWRVFAASIFSDAYLPSYCDYESEEGFSLFLKELRDCAVNYDEEAQAAPGGKILTLSTCIGNDKKHRLLVTASLAADDWLDP